MDKQFSDLLEKEFSRIGLPIEVYALSGEKLYPYDGGLDTQITMLHFDGDLGFLNGNIYLRLPSNTQILLSMPAGFPNAEQTLRLASALVSAVTKQIDRDMDREDVLRRVLTEGLDGTELEALAMEHGINMDVERCVVLFQAAGSAQAVEAALKALFEGSNNDYVVDIGRNSIVLIRAMEQVRFLELPEFVEAVATTTQEEAGIGFLAGIGEPRQNLSQIGQSLQEARAALEIGRTFHDEQSVFVYRFLMLERFMQEVPLSLAKKYYELLFNRRNSRVFNEEMIKTIDTFFDCHLNVSESARRLYIHRNTLVYRLDKVQKATGLDLRTFDDAITFKLLRMLGKREEIK